jgi:hypothetical protein
VSTYYLRTKIFKERIESKCRLRKEYEETVDYLASWCPIMRGGGDHIIMNEEPCTNLNYSMCNILCIETTENWYIYVPKSTCELEDITAL